MYFLVFAQFCYTIKAYKNFVGFRQKELNYADGLYALSFYESINISLLFKINSITGNISLDWIGVFTFLLVLNSIFFLTKKRYKIAFRVYDSLKANVKFNYSVGIFLYIVLSIAIVFLLF